MKQNKGSKSSKKLRVKKPKKVKPKTPCETDPLYKFYVSLFRQNPRSKMAITWLIEHGLGHIVLDVDSLQIS